MLHPNQLLLLPWHHHKPVFMLTPMGFSPGLRDSRLHLLSSTRTIGAGTQTDCTDSVRQVRRQKPGPSLAAPHLPRQPPPTHTCKSFGQAPETELCTLR